MSDNQLTELYGGCTPFKQVPLPFPLRTVTRSQMEHKHRNRVLKECLQSGSQKVSNSTQLVVWTWANLIIGLGVQKMQHRSF